ncbi:hypothetical protein Sinac_3496 [Singulisphaera acidiphila DSM 18658]|uniref:Uncharacterized protein n=1 Tax=Singulisphaera acidiphila (strain ATCC BAA-1392 / DSM 18658 / VKM B-2454 / MOB10) TaxID=886293 RepID=L0DER5_SINAD|nr:hypothetical protein Sinac_3496 [Singulisphaera acidiphila DSM 18658]
MTTASLCERCGWMRVITSGKGSRFLLCERAQADARFTKYPRQPVSQCLGYVERNAPKQG